MFYSKSYLRLFKFQKSEFNIINTIIKIFFHPNNNNKKIKFTITIR